MTDALSIHYSRALADAVFAPESGISPEDAVDQMHRVADSLSASPDLPRILLSPAVNRASKAKLIGKIVENSGLSRLIRNFLMVIVEHRRFGELKRIADGFEATVDERLGLARAEIISATELTGAQKDKLLQALGQKLGKNIRPVYSVDSSILGGVIARVGSKEYDGSVVGRLEQMRRQLSAAS
jgi:F-type H+-transporting ATPase subunit delta